jgi:hypothetical protein
MSSAATNKRFFSRFAGRHDYSFLEGVHMKKIAFLVLASLSFGVAGQAFAQSSGMTRAEVKQQLVQAEAQGLIPSGGTNYPPNARTIHRNREAYEAQHSGSASQSAYGGVSDEHKAN